MTMIMISAVIAPARLCRSLAVNRSIGIWLKVRLDNTLTQKGPRYHTAPSRGARANAGRVKRKAILQNPYATKSAGRNLPNAVLISGGGPVACENNEMCQNPMQNMAQKTMIGFGRRTMNRRQLESTLNASAGSRKSVQWVRDVVGANRNAIGNIVGKPIDDKPEIFVN